MLKEFKESVKEFVEDPINRMALGISAGFILWYVGYLKGIKYMNVIHTDVMKGFVESCDNNTSAEEIIKALKHYWMI